MEDVTRVEWRSWGEPAFAEARERGVPVLLSLTATWCEDCHEMDAETYAVPVLAANVDDGFVPVRVDVDRRPRVRDRYNVGGFPATVFLTPGGSVLTGAGYLGPDGFRDVLDSVRELWNEQGAEAGRIPRVLSDDGPPAGTLSETVEATMVGRLRENYDEVAGGWGEAPKFPLPHAVEFALKRNKEMARRTLEALRANLFDEHEGGFYRFAENRDWSGLHREKRLDANAGLLGAFSNAYLYTGEESYRELAERTIEFLTTTLWIESVDGEPGDRGAFAGSQPPDEPEAYTLEASDREATERVPVDRTVFAGANALAVEGLCTYAAYTDDIRARTYAERALSTLRSRLVDAGEVHHFLVAQPGDGSRAQEPDWRTNTAGGRSSAGSEPSCLLADQARVLACLTAARQTFGLDTLGDARAVADATIERCRDGDSFVDGPSSGPGLLSEPLRPLGANVELADALLDLSILTDEGRYRRVASDSLAAFAGASDRFGPDAASYASACARIVDDPIVIRVADEPGSDLHRAASRIADHEAVVVPDAEEIEPGTASAERGERVTEPAETPPQLLGRLETLLA